MLNNYLPIVVGDKYSRRPDEKSASGEEVNRHRVFSLIISEGAMASAVNREINCFDGMELAAENGQLEEHSLALGTSPRLDRWSLTKI